MSALLSQMLRIGPPATKRAGVVLTVARDGSWFRWDDAPPIDLSRRTHSRVLLRALIARHAGDPLGCASVGELGSAIHPGPITASTRARVYEAIATLRELGLKGRIEQGSAGYRLVHERLVVTAPWLGAPR